MAASCRRLLVGILVFAAWSPFAAGCGRSGVATYPAGGTVTFQDGTPVTFGSVEFYHAEHDLTSRGTIQPDGSFRLGTYAEGDGAPAGEHQVVVTQLIVPAEAGITPRDHGRHVAEKYARYETSNLRLQVTAEGSNSLRIVVQAEVRGVGTL